MSRRFSRAFALTAALALAPFAPAAEAQISGMARPQPAAEAFLLSFEEDVRGCDRSAAGDCFPDRFAAALGASSGPVSVMATLRAAGNGSPRMNLLIASQEGQQGPPTAFRTPGLRQFALLVGVSDYGPRRLASPLQNIARMEETLRREGFETRSLLNPDARGLAEALQVLRADLASASPQQALALIYLDGAGLQLDGENLFCASDAQISLRRIRESCLGVTNFLLRDLAPSILIVNAPLRPLDPEGAK